MLPRIFAFAAFMGLAATLGADQADKPKSAREALQAFSDLIGTWNGTGTPVGSLEEKQKKFWTEKMSWEWQFKNNDAWLKVGFEKSKNFSAGDISTSLVQFNTTDGPMKVTFFDAQAPQTVANFYDYINTGAYKNIIFSRLDTNPPVLQGGAPKGA